MFATNKEIEIENLKRENARLRAENADLARRNAHMESVLNDPKRLARSSDPDTAKNAARAVSETLGDVERLVLGFVANNPNLSASELCLIQKEVGIRTVSTRLSGLVRKGRIIISGKRECSVTRKVVNTYAIAPFLGASEKTPGDNGFN